MSKQLGLLSDTCEQLQLELHWHIQQATTDCTRIAEGLHLPNGQRQSKSCLRSSSKCNRMSQGSLEIISSHHSAQRRAAYMGWSLRTLLSWVWLSPGMETPQVPGYLAAAMTDHPCSDRALSCVKMSFLGSQLGPIASPPAPETTEKRLGLSPLPLYQVFLCADEIFLNLLTPAEQPHLSPHLRHSRSLLKVCHWTPVWLCITLDVPQQG